MANYRVAAHVAIWLNVEADSEEDARNNALAIADEITFETSIDEFIEVTRVSDVELVGADG